MFSLWVALSWIFPTRTGNGLIELFVREDIGNTIHCVIERSIHDLGKA